MARAIDGGAEAQPPLAKPRETSVDEAPLMVKATARVVAKAIQPK
jgi:hypothetical protein